MESFYEKRLWSRSQFTGVCEIVSNKKSVQGLKLQAEYEVDAPDRVGSRLDVGNAEKRSFGGMTLSYSRAGSHQRVPFIEFCKLFKNEY